MPEQFVKIQVIGARKLSQQIKLLTKEYTKDLQKRLRRSALVVVGSIQKQMGGSRTRAVRRNRPVTAKPHQLGIDTGTLRRSIGARTRHGVWRQGRLYPRGFFIDAGTRVRYGLVHELGLKVRTRSGTTYNMKKRPFFDPGIKAALPQVKAIMDGVIKGKV